MVTDGTATQHQPGGAMDKLGMPKLNKSSQAQYFCLLGRTYWQIRRGQTTTQSHPETREYGAIDNDVEEEVSMRTAREVTEERLKILSSFLQGPDLGLLLSVWVVLDRKPSKPCPSMEQLSQSSLQHRL
jgi:hypothetical protein